MKRAYAKIFLFALIITFTNTRAQDIRWLRVGQLQSFVSDYGSESEFMPIASDLFSWPAQYGVNQTTCRARGLWIGAKNFYDPVIKKTLSIKVVGSGPRYDATNQPEMVFSRSIKMIGKSNHPSVLVDNKNASVNEMYDVLDEVDPSLPCDRMVVVKFNTSMGVSVTKKVMAFVQQNHSNYFIYDYVFKNTGIYTEAGDTLQQTLNDFFVHFNYRYAFAGVTSTGYGSTWGAFGSEWGGSTINHDFGPFRPLSYGGTTSGQMRGFYSFYGPIKDRPVTYDQDWGCPKQDGGGPGLNGLLGSAKYAGCVTIFASQSPQNYGTDDSNQPTTTSYFGADEEIEGTNVSQYDVTLMSQRYSRMSEGHLPQSNEEAVGNQYVSDWGATSDRWGGMQGQGYGPYTLAPGDSIHIVFAEGVDGLSWEQCREVGAVWYEYYTGNSAPSLIMPDGSTGSSYTNYTKAWVQSGVDSLLKTFNNAIANYHSGYAEPQAPPAPDKFEVLSGGDRIHLRWSNNAESAPHFNGYVIYRSEGVIEDYHAVYEKIFECSSAAVVHEFDDTTAVAATDYYYYIQSKDDGTQNDVHPGVPLYSSMFLTMTNSPARLNVYHVDDFRSHQSGDWNDVNTWERLDGSAWVSPAPYTPSSTNGKITIASDLTLSITSSDTVDQLEIEPNASLIIQANGSLHVNNGDSLDMVVYGSLTNLGNFSQDNSASILFEESSEYNHKRNGGTIPLATWKGTCNITDVTTQLPFNISQSFNQLIWNCPNQNANFSLHQQGKSIGRLSVLNTNRNPQSANTPSFYLSLYDGNGVSSIGRLTISGAHAAVVGQDGNYNDTVSIGPLSISGGGMFLLSNTDNGSLINYLWGSIVCPDSGYFGTTNPHTTVIFNSYINELKIPLSGFTFIGETNYNVVNGCTFTLGQSVIYGSGSFSIDSGATIITSHPDGLDGNIQVTGTKTVQNGTNFTFNGKVPQVTGSFFPDSIGSLIVTNDSLLTLQKDVVCKSLQLVDSRILSDSKKISYDTGGTLIYSGVLPRITSTVEFPEVKGPSNLGVQVSQGVTLHQSRTLPGIVDLSSTGKLLLGNNNLATNSVLNATPTAYIVTNGTGKLIQPQLQPGYTSTFPVGISTGYAPVVITNTGTVDTFSVSVCSDTGKAVNGGRVKAKWIVDEKSAGDGIYRIKFGWMSTMEDSIFSSDKNTYSKIIRLSDTTELPGSVTTGKLTTNYPFGYTVQNMTRINYLTTFTVGHFSSLTGVEETPADIPTVFSLSQNYPNPFNPSTKISFGIPKQSFVTLKVYDAIGREVTTLVSEPLSAGYYQRTWNASAMASGVYFCRIQAGDFVNTKKLILLK